MTDQEKEKKGKEEVQKIENLKDERSFFGKIKSIFDIIFFLIFILMKRKNIVDTSFNSHNNISYLIHVLHI